MSILQKIIAAIIGLFISNFPKWIEKSFNKIPKEIAEEIEVVIKIVDAWKDNPAIDAITLLIPGTWDDEFIKSVRKILDYFDLSAGEERHIAASKITEKLTGFSFGQAAITTEVVWQKLNKK